MWDLPRPGLKPVSPALAGGFLTTAPPGKPIYVLLLFTFYWSIVDLQCCVSLRWTCVLLFFTFCWSVVDLQCCVSLRWTCVLLFLIFFSFTSISLCLPGNFSSYLSFVFIFLFSLFHFSLFLVPPYSLYYI